MGDLIFIPASERMPVVVGINVPGGGPWPTARRSKPKSGADDQLHCVGESRITSHNIAAFRHPTDSMKDSKQGELIEEESRWAQQVRAVLLFTRFEELRDRLKH